MVEIVKWVVQWMLNVLVCVVENWYLRVWEDHNADTFEQE